MSMVPMDRPRLTARQPGTASLTTTPTGRGTRAPLSSRALSGSRRPTASRAATQTDWGSSRSDGLEGGGRGAVRVPDRGRGRGVAGGEDVPASSRRFEVDEVLRDTSLEKLASLKPVAREDGIHTAGTSSQIADGASAVLLMTADRAAELGMRPRARVLGSCLVGCDPVLMLEGPIPATNRLLAMPASRWTTSTSSRSTRHSRRWSSPGSDGQGGHGEGQPERWGHRAGPSVGRYGCILVTKAIDELERSDSELALVTMCCGGGLGTGTLLQRVDGTRR